MLQGYDGASVMSGNCSGVQTRLKEFAPHAVYIHCHAHILKLVLVDSVKAVPDATQRFALVESLCNLIYYKGPCNLLMKAKGTAPSQANSRAATTI